MSTLLSNSDKKGAAAFVIKLLHAVTGAHILHLQQTGPGSYARHIALGDFYSELEDLADAVAEDWQGLHGLIDAYPAGFDMPSGDPYAYVKGLYDFVQGSRKVMGSESHIQNNIDEICSLMTRTMYKLKNLA